MKKKTSIVLNVILSLCVLALLVIVKPTELDNVQTNDVIEASDPTTLEVIHQRKSVRKFTDQVVSKSQLETLVKAGMAAPSAVNRQPWAFVAVEDRATLDALSAGLPYAKMLTTASAAIIVCGDMTKALDGAAQEYWIQDCSAASQNILLAVESLGLGAVWTGVYPSEERMQIVRQALDLPAHIIPLNVIPVGYPTGVEKAKDKWKAENMHWNKW